MPVIGFILLGLGAGFLGGSFGIGGGIVIVPALVYLAAFDQKRAQGTSLVALLAPVGLFGLMNYWRAGKADLVAGAWISAGFLGGAFFGSKLALSLNEVVLRKSFSLFLVLVAVQLFFKK